MSSWRFFRKVESVLYHPHILWHWPEHPRGPEIIHCPFKQMSHHPALPFLLRHECYQAGGDTGSHRHADFYALYIVQAGRGIHVINSHPYPIVRGDVYALPPGTVHAYQQYHALEITACYFQSHLFSESELSALRALPGFWNLLIGLDPSPLTPPASHEHRLHLPPEHHRILNDILTELCTEYLAPSPETTLLTHHLLFRLLVHIARWQTHEETKLTTTPEPTTHSMSIADVLRICEERFHEPLTVAQLAALLFLSPSHFSALFTQEVGVSPSAYIRRLRLARAQTLLRTTTLSITKIAQQTGFGDGPHLARAFQSAFHLTPSAYRATFS